jgi:hypothetical protein
MDIKDFKPVVDLISQYSPAVGSFLGKPFAGIAVSSVAALIAKFFNANPEDPRDLLNKIKADNLCEEKIKAIELLIQEIKVNQDRNDARNIASKETGMMKYIRPFLIFMANVTLGIDLIVMYYLFKEFDPYVLPFIMITILCTYYLIKDIRKMTAFYFGSDN